MLAGCLLGSSGVFAAEKDAPPPPAPDEPTVEQERAPKQVPPPLPDEAAEDSRIPPKPEVRIIHRKDATIEEYRVGGQLRYAKIIPRSGPAYYMIDTDGDGVLDKRHNNLENPPVQQWLLLQW